MNTQTGETSDLQQALNHYYADEELVLSTIAKYDAFNNRASLYDHLTSTCKQNKTQKRQERIRGELNRIFQLRERGVLNYSYLEIAAKLGMCKNTVAKYAEKLGYNFTRTVDHSSKYQSDKTIPFEDIMTGDHYYSFWNPTVEEVVVKFLPYCEFNNLNEFNEIRKDKGFPSRQQKWENEKHPKIKQKLEEKENGSNMTLEDIGIALNVSVGAIQTVKENNDYNFNGHGGRTALAEKHDVEFSEFAQDYYEDDLTLLELAEKYTGRKEYSVAQNLIRYFDLPRKQAIKRGDVDTENIEWYDSSQFNEEDLQDVMSDLVGEDEEVAA